MESDLLPHSYSDRLYAVPILYRKNLYHTGTLYRLILYDAMKQVTNNPTPYQP